MAEAEWLDKIADRFPHRPALARGLRVVASFSALRTQAAQLADLLQQMGAQKGDRIGIFAQNTPSFITTLYGIWWAGMVAVPINAKLHPDELAYILNHAGIAHLFASTDTQAAAEDAIAKADHAVQRHDLDALDDRVAAMTPAARQDVAPDDLAWLFYTSGTTGRPKGAMLTYRNLDEMARGFLETVAPVVPEDCIIHAAPLSHGSGLYALPHLRQGACQVIPESGGFDVEELATLLDHWSGVSMFAAPTMVNRLVRSDIQLTETQRAHLKVIVYGGAPMYAEDAEQALTTLGPKLAQIYGQGESPMTITCLSRDVIAGRDQAQWRDRLASVGVAFPQVKLAVKTEDGSIQFKEAQGEVLVRGEVVMKGYWQDPEATAAAIIDGWLHTGDIGHIAGDGYLTLLDRSKDLIISGGANIYPREVEEILLTHPDVQDVSVIGRPDPDWGEVVVAYYTGKAKAADLDALCLERIARFKRPKDYVQIDHLPKSNYGKVLKSSLREIDAHRQK